MAFVTLSVCLSRCISQIPLLGTGGGRILWGPHGDVPGWDTCSMHSFLFPSVHPSVHLSICLSIPAVAAKSMGVLGQHRFFSPPFFQPPPCSDILDARCAEGFLGAPSLRLGLLGSSPGQESVSVTRSE